MSTQPDIRRLAVALVCGYTNSKGEEETCVVVTTHAHTKGVHVDTMNPEGTRAYRQKGAQLYNGEGVMPIKQILAVFDPTHEGQKEQVRQLLLEVFLPATTAEEWDNHLAGIT